MSSSEAALLVAHLAATWAMVGLIWFVQVVHYPLFALVGGDGFVGYSEAHRRRTGFVVGLPMAIEGVTALALVAAPPGGVGRALPLVGLGLLAVVLGSTVWLQVPLHSRLGVGYDAEATRRLVATNVVRTVGWTARGLVVAAMLVLAAT